MGFIFSKTWTKLIGKKDVRILMLGLDAAGKTTALYQLKIGENVKSIPTIGFNVESLDYKGLHMTVWDVGGQHKIRMLWEHYYQNTDALIFVVDSNDPERMEEAKEELYKIVSNDELKGAAILVLANKQDISGAMSPNEITEKLELSKNKTNQWLVQGTCANTGQGLKEGFDWLANALNNKKKK